MTADTASAASGEPNASTKACPYCREAIHPAATKCSHCGETLENRPPFKAEIYVKKTVTYIGLITAALSLFYALREGYYFIEQRQAQRDALAAQVAAASQFEQLDNLNYAVAALDRALEIAPNNLALERRRFLLRAHYLLREQEDWGLQGLTDHGRKQLPGLTLDGFRLLHFTQSEAERADVLVMLGRLLVQDQDWNDDARITTLLEEAHDLMPQSGEAAYRLGRWLLTKDSPEPERGVPLMETAIRLDPENALYWSGLGDYWLAQESFEKALGAFRSAIALAPKQRDLQRLRAANSSKGELRVLLSKADKASDITSADFLGLSVAERLEVLDVALRYSLGDRHLHYLAARLHFAEGDYDRAIEAIKASLWEELPRASRSDGDKLELYARILEQSGRDSRTLDTINEILGRRAEATGYEEALELRRDDEERFYKIGLKVHAGTSEEGLLVARAYEGYPFAKAGVTEGDRIVELAHRPLRRFRDLWLPLIEFDPGTSLPLKVMRGGEMLDFTLIVE